MNRFFRPNSLIDETQAVCKKRTFFKVSITFLLVYMIGNFLTNMIMTAPMTAYVMGDKEISEIMSSNLSTDEYTQRINEVLTRIYSSLPDWLNAVSLIATIGTVAVVIFYCIKIEKRRFYTLGFSRKGFIWEYLAGLGIGLVMFAAVYGIGVLSGELAFSGFNLNLPWGTFILFLFGFIIQGASEEILLRGYYFVSSASCGSVPTAVFVSSGLFAVMHLGNNGVNLLAVFNILLFGLFAAIYFLRRGSIWGICAIHTMWNFAQANIFGCKVSGLDFSTSVISTAEKGGVWSGGAFGPESGLGTTIILAIAIILVFFMKNKNHDEFYLRKSPEAKSMFY